MTVALGTTLIDKAVATLLLFGKWKEIYDRTTNGTDMFIGCMVTEASESGDDIDRCEEDEMPLGVVLGYAPPDIVDTEDYFLKDFDDTFGDGKKVYVGAPERGAIFLGLSETNTTIKKSDPLKIITGVFKGAATGDDIVAIAREPVTGANNTRKYFYLEWR